MTHTSLPQHRQVEIIPNRLYFTAFKSTPSPSALPARGHQNTESHWFQIDDTLHYEPFFNDFGPLNLSCTMRFIHMLFDKLRGDKVIHFYCTNQKEQLSNAAVLLGAYQILQMGRSVQEAYSALSTLGPFTPFRDANPSPQTYHLTVQHCLQAISDAATHKFFDPQTFDSQQYEYFERVENGDLNLIVQGQFLAFAGPIGRTFDKSSEDGGDASIQSLCPEDYVPILQMYNCQSVVRLNKKMYNARDFTQAGLHHHDLFFIDGSTPSNSVLDKFLTVCETELQRGAIAVHCKAGLGRTGTTIGCYLMKRYFMEAPAVIAWLRICRPGSVIGPQQEFMQQQQQRMHKAGKAMYHSIKATPAAQHTQQFTNMQSPTETRDLSSANFMSDDSDMSPLTGASGAVQPVSMLALQHQTVRKGASDHSSKSATGGHHASSAKAKSGSTTRGRLSQTHTLTSTKSSATHGRKVMAGVASGLGHVSASLGNSSIKQRRTSAIAQQSTHATRRKSSLVKLDVKM